MKLFCYSKSAGLHKKQSKFDDKIEENETHVQDIIAIPSYSGKRKKKPGYETTEQKRKKKGIRAFSVASSTTLRITVSKMLFFCAVFAVLMPSRISQKWPQTCSRINDVSPSCGATTGFGKKKNL
jgi:hypothetical protein